VWFLIYFARFRHNAYTVNIVWPGAIYALMNITGKVFFLLREGGEGRTCNHHYR